MAMGFGPLADPKGRTWQGRSQQQAANRKPLLQGPGNQMPKVEPKQGRFKQFMKNYSSGGRGPSLMKRRQGSGALRSLY